MADEITTTPNEMDARGDENQNENINNSDGDPDHGYGKRMNTATPNDHESQPDVDGDDDDDVNDEGSSPLRVLIDRPASSTADLHRRYGYRADQAGRDLRGMVREKMSGVRCGLDTLRGVILYIFPAFAWLPGYKVRSYLIKDVVAGVTVGIVNIPMSMAFALLAGLPPVYGLYTAFFAPLAFFFMGSSRHTSFGTFGVVSLLAASVVERILAERYPDTTTVSTTTSSSTDRPITTVTGYVTSPCPNDVTATDAQCGPLCEDRVRLHTALCLLVGIIQMAMAVLRLGSLSAYLSQPLVRAFTTGAACHIITSQVPPLFGLALPIHTQRLSLLYTWRDFFVHLGDTNVATLLVAALCFVILVPGKYVSKRWKNRIRIPIPWELILVVLIVIISHFGNIAGKYCVDIIKEIPIGFPTPSVPPGVSFGDLIGEAIAIAIVSFAVSLSLARIVAEKRNYEVNPNQELLAYGASHMTSSFFSCFASASAPSRVFLLASTGAKTQVSMLVSSVIVACVLLFLAPVFEPLPKCVLSAIIITALRTPMSHFKDLTMLYRSSKIDCSIWLVTWLAVVVVGVEIGLGVGLVYSLLTVLFRMQRARLSSQGRLAGSELYRDDEDYIEAKKCPSVHIVQLQGSLYFANADQFRKALYRQTGGRPVPLLRVQLHKPARDVGTYNQFQNSDGFASRVSAVAGAPLQTIIIDCRYFSFVDAVGAKTLLAIYREYRMVGIATVFCSCADSVMQSLQLMLEQELDEHEEKPLFFPSVHDAVTMMSPPRLLRANQEHGTSDVTNNMNHDPQTAEHCM